MAGRGIEVVVTVDREGNEHIKRRMYFRQVFTDTWIKNENVDNQGKKGMSVLWKKLSTDLVTPTDVVKILLASDDFATQKIKKFQANGNIVNVSDIYPDVKGGFYCFFKKKGVRWSLLQVRSKSVKEMQAVGEDYDGYSNLPLVAYKTTSEEGQIEFHFPNF